MAMLFIRASLVRLHNVISSDDSTCSGLSTLDVPFNVCAWIHSFSFAEQWTEIYLN
jgi:hypothetical protein